MAKTVEEMTQLLVLVTVTLKQSYIDCSLPRTIVK